MVNKQSNKEYFLAPVQDLLVRVEEVMRVQSDCHHPALGLAMEQLISSGGKRIRPAVALLTGGMLSGDIEKLVTLSASIEMLHSATLVHDDLIDGALLRRGNVTLNAQWSPAATVLTGDFIFARAAKLASETDSVAVIRLFADTLAMIVNGELKQLFNNRVLTNREDYNQRIYAKTASMFELATAAAALLSPVQSMVVERLREFGYSIGMAFQIVDDVLDFTGEQTRVGKPVSSDLRQGVITLPALYFLESFPDDPELQIIINGGIVPEESFERLVSSIRSSGAIYQSMEEARSYVEHGLDLLRDMPDNRERRALEELAHYIIQRDL